MSAKIDPVQIARQLNRIKVDGFHMIEKDEIQALAKVVIAAEPIAAFIAAWDAMPLNTVGDDFYTIHGGTDYEAKLRLSELRALAAALKSYEAEDGEP